MIAYGISSKIPHSFFHNLLVDLDVDSPSCLTESTRFLRHSGFSPRVFISPHGFHLLVLHPFHFAELVKFMPLIPNIDLDWFKIGAERGYWFLQTYEPIHGHARQITFMRINRNAPRLR